MVTELQVMNAKAVHWNGENSTLIVSMCQKIVSGQNLPSIQASPIV